MLLIKNELRSETVRENKTIFASASVINTTILPPWHQLKQEQTRNLQQQQNSLIFSEKAVWQSFEKLVTRKTACGSW